MSSFLTIQNKIQNFFGDESQECLEVIKEAINTTIFEINDECPELSSLKKSTNFTCTVGTTLVTGIPPSDMDKLLNIYLYNSDGDQLAPLVFLEKNQWNRDRIHLLGAAEPEFYTQYEAKIYIAPKPDIAYTGTLEYFAYESEMVSDSDTSSIQDTYPRWERVIIQGVKAKMYEYFQDDQEMIDNSYKKFRYDLLRFRAWTRRNLNKSPVSTRMKGWKETAAWL